MIKEAKTKAFATIGAMDFDFASMPAEGEKQAELLIPSRQTIRERLKGMVSASDLGQPAV
jgi:hypothetical protein